MKFNLATTNKPMPAKFKKAYDNAATQVLQYFTDAVGTQPLSSYEDVMSSMPNIDSAAGFTFPGKSKRQVQKDAFHLARGIAHKVKNFLSYYQVPSKFGMRS